jgi:hypothetical protein
MRCDATCSHHAWAVDRYPDAVCGHGYRRLVRRIQALPTVTFIGGSLPVVRSAGKGTNCVRFDAEGLLFAAGHADGTLRVYHMDEFRAADRVRDACYCHAHEAGAFCVITCAFVSSEVAQHRAPHSTAGAGRQRESCRYGDRQRQWLCCRALGWSCERWCGQ